MAVAAVCCCGIPHRSQDCMAVVSSAAVDHVTVTKKWEVVELRSRKVKVKTRAKVIKVRLKPLKFEIKLPKMRRSSRRKRR